MKHIIFGLALLTGFGASAQISRPTDAQSAAELIGNRCYEQQSSYRHYIYYLSEFGEVYIDAVVKKNGRVKVAFGDYVDCTWKFSEATGRVSIKGLVYNQAIDMLDGAYRNGTSNQHAHYKYQNGKLIGQGDVKDLVPCKCYNY